jgi:hypothetical protein
VICIHLRERESHCLVPLMIDYNFKINRVLDNCFDKLFTSPSGYMISDSHTAPHPELPFILLLIILSVLIFLVKVLLSLNHLLAVYAYDA